MAGRNPSRQRAAQAGISLVETLVALALGLALVTVAFNLHVSNLAVFAQIEAMTRLQESASIAAALLETDLRHAEGTLCRHRQPLSTTVAVNATSNHFFARETTGLEGVHFYSSDPSAANYPDAIVGADRIAGDSISITSDNRGAVARVVADSASAAGSSYTFTVDDASQFPAGTLAMACDYNQAVLFQVSGITDTAGTDTITLSTTGTTTPGNCSIYMRLKAGDSRDQSANTETPYAFASHLTQCMTSSEAEMYLFRPGSMIGQHTFNHWYIGRKTGAASGAAGSALRRRSMTVSGGVLGYTDEEIVEDVSNMKISYLSDYRNTGYPAPFVQFPTESLSFYSSVSEWLRPRALDEVDAFSKVLAIRIELTLTSPARVGLAANNVASAPTFSIPINVAIRARMPGVVRR
jgi:Tfp pilus assembly protein PilW